VPAPLAGKRILDLGALCRKRPHSLAISMAAKLCAGFGAKVWRPAPTSGEPLAVAPPILPNGNSALDMFLNRDKLPGKAAASYDAAIGDEASLAEHASGVPIGVRISVFGPGEDPSVTELSLLALTGLLGLVGTAEGPPTRLAGHQLAYAAGLAACTGLLAAFHAGGGEMVDVSLFDVGVWLNWKAAIGILLLGTGPERDGPRNHWMTVAAVDGFVALVYQEKDWPLLREMVGNDRLDDPRFATMASRGEHRAALLAEIGPWFRSRTRAEITAAAQRRRIPIGPVKWPAELLRDPQHLARGFLEANGMPCLPLVWNGRRLAREPSHAA